MVWISRREMIGSFTTTCSDANGWPQMKWVDFSIGNQSTAADGLRAYYNQNNNRIYLLNDAGTGWIGGLTPGSAGTIENSRVILRMVDTSVSGTADTLRVTWSLRFKALVDGDKKIWLRVRDDSGASSDWKQKGTWTVHGAGGSEEDLPEVTLEPMEEEADEGLWEVPMLEPVEEEATGEEWEWPVLEPMEEEPTYEEWDWLELEPVEDEAADEEGQMPVLEPLEDEGADAS